LTDTYKLHFACAVKQGILIFLEAW